MQIFSPIVHKNKFNQLQQLYVNHLFSILGIQFLQVFDTLPQDREVNPGELIVIPCKVRNRKGECAWLKDGVVVGKIPGKYTFNREPDDGDCGITITNTQLEDDDGLWQCQVTQASLQELTLTSPEVKLTVRGELSTYFYYAYINAIS